MCRLRRREIQRRRAPAHGLVHGAVTRLLHARGMARVTGKTQPRRKDAAMRQHRLAPGRFSHDDRLVATLTRQRPGDGAQEAGNTPRIIGLLVGGEQQCQVAIAGMRHCQQGRGGALDVAGAQANRTVAGDAQRMWIGAPRG